MLNLIVILILLYSFQVKIWFQNRRTKWKKHENISNAEAAEHKVVNGKSPPQPATSQASDVSDSSLTACSPQPSEPGSTTEPETVRLVSHQVESEAVRTDAVPANSMVATVIAPLPSSAAPHVDGVSVKPMGSSPTPTLYSAPASDYPSPSPSTGCHGNEPEVPLPGLSDAHGVLCRSPSQLASPRCPSSGSSFTSGSPSPVPLTLATTLPVQQMSPSRFGPHFSSPVTLNGQFPGALGAGIANGLTALVMSERHLEHKAASPQSWTLDR